MLDPCEVYAQGKITRVSVSSAGVQGNNASQSPSVSYDGRFVAFTSYADNLVDGDTNYIGDIFVHDRQTDQTTRVSVSSAGVQGNNTSYSPSISSDGRFVAFESYARNLVDGDTNGSGDIFVHDRQTGQTTRVSVSSEGMQGNKFSFSPSISYDGRFVAFRSYAGNLVDGDTNGDYDIFVNDRQTGQTTRVSVSSAGVQGNRRSNSPTISSWGRYVAFVSYSDNLVDGDTNSDDDPNSGTDVFVHDRETVQTIRVSVTSTGVQGDGTNSNPSITSDGRFVAFRSRAGNLVDGDTNRDADILVHDRQTGQIARVSVTSTGVQGNDGSDSPSISSDGRFVAFESYSDNLVDGDTNGDVESYLGTDIFVHDRQTGQITRVSVSSAGMQGNRDSHGPSISYDSRFVAFESYADNLVDGDTNDSRDIFIYDLRSLSTGQSMPFLPLLLIGD
jgi:Tol biopolymer transport system component